MQTSGSRYTRACVCVRVCSNKRWYLWITSKLTANGIVLCHAVHLEGASKQSIWNFTLSREQTKTNWSCQYDHKHFGLPIQLILYRHSTRLAKSTFGIFPSDEFDRTGCKTNNSSFRINHKKILIDMNFELWFGRFDKHRINRTMKSVQSRTQKRIDTNDSFAPRAIC